LSVKNFPFDTPSHAAWLFIRIIIKLAKDPNENIREILNYARKIDCMIQIHEILQGLKRRAAGILATISATP
jgi:hypothetical protein